MTVRNAREDDYSGCCYAGRRPCGESSYAWMCGLEQQLLPAAVEEKRTRNGHARTRDAGEEDHMTRQAFAMLAEGAGGAAARVPSDALVELCFIVTRVTYSVREVQAAAIAIHPSYRAEGADAASRRLWSTDGTHTVAFVGLDAAQCQRLVDQLETQSFM